MLLHATELRNRNKQCPSSEVWQVTEETTLPMAWQEIQGDPGQGLQPGAELLRVSGKNGVTTRLGTKVSKGPVASLMWF